MSCSGIEPLPCHAQRLGAYRLRPHQGNTTATRPWPVTAHRENQRSSATPGNDPGQSLVTLAAAPSDLPSSLNRVQHPSECCYWLELGAIQLYPSGGVRRIYKHFGGCCPTTVPRDTALWWLVLVHKDSTAAAPGPPGAVLVAATRRVVFACFGDGGPLGFVNLGTGATRGPV